MQSLTGYGLSRLDGWPDRQTAEDLAAETVVVALCNYVITSQCPFLARTLW
ncbi:hypothetical protein [Mycobacterium sp. P7213]|uniref:hypothetical protein n=1 Tax=Mycobacterium sp. P7213 TaxID=2478465 RepID=UPI001F1558E9|nr:hypothetical protein [Mycobacterium sp. P7213]